MKTFFLVLRQLYLNDGESEKMLPERAAQRLGCAVEDIVGWKPVRKSLDARKRFKRRRWVYHLRLEMPAAWRKKLRLAAFADPGLDIQFEKRTQALFQRPGDPSPPAGRARPVVVGAGPAGLFAALRLARAGWRPILVERGDPLDRRRQTVAAFWRTGRLDPESNPLFGEGGAGLFSDGKLNTRHKDREGIVAILESLVDAGAPEDILVNAEPHVGSDLLGEVTANLMREIRDRGGETRHRTRLVDLLAEDGRLRAVELLGPDGSAVVETENCVLAAGHSARDVYEMLHARGVGLEAKPFAVGLRVEMPQAGIDLSQGGRVAKRSGAAAFRLSRPPSGGAASCYTFCMCPGGMVIAAASEPGCLAVNGMSYHARAGDWGNAAFLSPVGPEDFVRWSGGDGERAGPLAGIAFQRHWERKNYQAGLPGGAYAVPASSLAAFVAGTTGSLPEARGADRAAAANLRELLPPRIADTLADAIPAMLSRLRKVDRDQVVLYGIETRTSSPVRVRRDADGVALGMAGLLPAGEGSGYAGGITTSALDGWKAAANLMRR